MHDNDELEALDQRIDQGAAQLLRTEQGRDFLLWLLELGPTDVSPFVVEPLTTARNCGKQELTLQVCERLMRVDPQGYFKVLQERTQRHARRTHQPDGTWSSNYTGDDLSADYGTGFVTADAELEPEPEPDHGAAFLGQPDRGPDEAAE